MTTPSEHTSPAMQRILALLVRKSDMSASDMSREAFVGITTLACGGYLKALRAKKLVHVSGWRKTRNGFVTPLFSLGYRPDLPRPRFEDEDRDSAGLGLNVLLALCAIKVIATVFSYSSGGAGGIFAPSLFVGAMLGTLGGAARSGA